MGINVNIRRKDAYVIRDALTAKASKLKRTGSGKAQRLKVISLLHKLSDMLSGKPSHVSKAQSVQQNQSTRSKRSSASHGGSHRVNGNSSGSSSGSSSGDPDPEPARSRLTRLLATRLDVFKEVLA